MKQSKKVENDISSLLLKFSRWVPLCVCNDCFDLGSRLSIESLPTTQAPQMY